VLARGSQADKERAGELIQLALLAHRRHGTAGASGLAAHTAPQPPADTEAAVLRWDADSWDVGFAGARFRLVPLQGIALIAELLRRPGEDVPAAALLRAVGGEPSPSPERSRVAVTKAVSAAYRKIGEHCPELRTYLAAHISTGRICRFRPDPAAPVRWTLGATGADR
jgi:hypothetical protein